MGERGARIFGNDQYFREVEDQMVRHQLTDKQAETRLLHMIIMRMRVDGRKKHSEIAEILSKRYGFSVDAYYRRLREIRKTKPLP